MSLAWGGVLILTALSRRQRGWPIHILPAEVAKLRESYRQYPLCRPEGANRNEGQPEGAALVG
jgi:hypothetical protein